MEKRILFETSPWFIILCLVAGVLYALLLYWKKNPWHKGHTVWLAVIRFIAVSTIAFLLLGPMIRQIRNTIIPPTLIIALDDSQSILLSYAGEEPENLKNDIKGLREALSDDNLSIVVRNLGGDIIEDLSRISYDRPATDLSKTLRDIENDYEGRNLTGVVLVTDGIYNQGFSPAYTNFSFPVYTVGVGDTIEKKDLVLKSLYYNKIVYQGNQFPLIAELTHSGFKGSNITIDVYKGSERIVTKNLSLTSDKGFQQVEFELEATVSGLQRYRVMIRPVENEFSTDNNSRDAYIEVVEGKQKILLLASAPHPDIKALRNAIEKNDNYELSLVIQDIHKYKPDKYDVMILHQLPDKKNSLQNIINDLLASNMPVMYILGNRSNINRFNNLNQSLTIRMIRNQYDNVFPAVNSGFTLFALEEPTRNLIAELPPVAVPFGDYTARGDIEIMMYQQVGKIVTSKPLLILNSNQAQKEAVFTGEGLWQWRLHDFKINQEFSAFDDLISKVIQYLSAREDKRKFRVYPVNTENAENEPVQFETEIYNDIYENIYGNKIDLSITGENDSTLEYSYVTSPGNSTFRVSNLKSGVYHYAASTQLNGEMAEVRGMFSVKEMQLESVSLTADHGLLKELARRSGGQYYTVENLPELQQELLEEEQQSIITSSERYLSIINLKWLFFLILILLTVEWGFRKYLGGY